jgi:hypothetical protein
MTRAKKPKADGWCAECGETVTDEDGCCALCGVTAIGPGAVLAVLALRQAAEVERLRVEARAGPEMFQAGVEVRLRRLQAENADLKARHAAMKRVIPAGQCGCGRDEPWCPLPKARRAGNLRNKDWRKP